jgi:hypothetical protein
LGDCGIEELKDKIYKLKEIGFLQFLNSLISKLDHVQLIIKRRE